MRIKEDYMKKVKGVQGGSRSGSIELGCVCSRVRVEVKLSERGSISDEPMRQGAGAYGRVR